MASAVHDHAPGAVTFLFTDIEGSTRLIRDLGPAKYTEVLSQHRALLLEIFDRFGGRLVETPGDALFVVFRRAKDGIAAAAAAQKSLQGRASMHGETIRVRMGLHSGEPVAAQTGYVGLAVHRASRICDAGHGGQVLMSQTTADLVEGDLPEGVALRDLGEHQLKDFPRPEHLFQLTISGLPAHFPRLRSLPTARRRLQRAALLSVLVFLGLGIVALRLTYVKLAGPPLRSLAVLPLDNLSGDPGQEYLADGMTESLITTLGQISGLRVISRTSVMQFKGTKKSVAEIARTLGVQAVVEGAVMRVGDRVRITAKLIDAPSDRQMWAQSYERDVRDVLALQGEIARTIAQGIGARLTPREQIRLTQTRPVNPEAHAAYLRGRYNWNKQHDPETSKSVDFFRRAVELDPQYALAYIGLADAYIWLSYAGEAREVFLPKARSAVEKALELDPNLAEAHAALGSLLYQFDKDWVAAEQELRQAIELNPNSLKAHETYGAMLVPQGRHEEATREIRRAQELDPLSLFNRTFLALNLYFAGRYDDALAEGHKTVEIEPDFAWAYFGMGIAHIEKHQYEEAIAQIQKAIAIEGRWGIYLMQLARTHVLMGRKVEALKILKEMEDPTSRDRVAAHDIAVVYTALGDRDQAFAWLDKAVAQQDFNLVYLKIAPYFAALRSDPRFPRLLQKVGLAP